jgi:hypothetical protein
VALPSSFLHLPWNSFGWITPKDLSLVMHGIRASSSGLPEPHKWVSVLSFLVMCSLCWPLFLVVRKCPREGFGPFISLGSGPGTGSDVCAPFPVC